MPKSQPRQQGYRIAIAIMAAGKGTRLKSKHPKVLHEVGGLPLLSHVISAATQVVSPEHVYAIIGHEADRVRKAVATTRINFILQKEQRGTGHALMVSKDALHNYDQVIVLSGDAPLISAQTIRNLAEFHRIQKAAMTLLTAQLPNPFGYGRVIRKSSKSDDVRAIVEEKAASPAQKKIHEINAGFYAFQANELFSHIDDLSTNNPHGEFYLTDMAAALVKAKRHVVALQAADPHEILGGNTRAELVEIDQRMRMAKCQRLMAEGVTIFYPQTCVIDSNVSVGADTIIEPFVQILGNSRVGGDCRIRSYSVLNNSEIADNVTILPGCFLDQSKVHERAMVGPYSRLRPGSEICEGAYVGNFVETKNTKLGKGSKAGHLSYLGDSQIGDRVNIGAGTITCNYDGTRKHPTIIEDRVFVGSDTTLVAPLKIGKDAYIAAASCITDDVPEDALALGRARQAVKEGWARQRREKAK